MPYPFSSSSSSSESDGELETSECGKKKSGSQSPKGKVASSALYSGISTSSRQYGLEKRDHGDRSGAGSTNADDAKYKFIERRKLEEEKKKIMVRKNAVSVHERKKKATLSEEEMEKKRQQMMEDAMANNKERSGNVRRYNEEERREDMQERFSRKEAGHFSDSTQPDFVRPLVNAAYNSAEERIKRNINSVQRSRADQDKNFTKR